mgnify:FL=1
MARNTTAPLPINDLETWLTVLGQPTALTELAVMAG